MVTIGIFALILAIWIGKIFAGGMYRYNKQSELSPFSVVASSVQSLKTEVIDSLQEQFGDSALETVTATSTIKEKLIRLGEGIVNDEIVYSGDLTATTTYER